MKPLTLTISLCLAIIFFCFFSCKLEEVTLDCPKITAVNKERAPAGEVITLTCENLRFSSIDKYTLKIGNQTLVIASVSNSGSTQSMTFEVPVGMSSGIFSLTLKDFTCEGESNPDGVKLAYELSVQNISVMGEPEVSGNDDEHFDRPLGIEVLDGKVYVADQNNHVIMELDFDLSLMTCYAGQKDKAGCLPFADRKFSEFIVTSGLSINPGTNTIYVTDPLCKSVSWLDIGPNTGVLSTPGFDFPTGISVTEAGDVFVIDQNVNRIKQLENGTTISLFAGSENPSCLSQDGPTTSAKFCVPYDLVFDPDRNVYYVTEEIENSQLRMIRDNVVSTITPSNGTVLISKPTEMAIDREGNVYIASFGGKSILKYEVINNSLVVMDIPFVAFGFPGLKGPKGIAYDKQNDILYVSDTESHAVYKVELR